MHRCLKRIVAIAVVAGAIVTASSLSAQPSERPAFVIVERTATTGPESIQEDYAKLARDILPKYGGRYLARSRSNVLLEGEGAAPCCMALRESPILEAVRRWHNSPENREALKVRARARSSG